MTHPPRRRLGAHLQHRKRVRGQERLATLRQEARAQQRTLAAFRERRLTEAGTAKAEQPGAMRPVLARFPSRQPCASVDVGFQPAGARTKLQAVATGRVIAPGENVVCWGPPGTGQTPLAIACGLQAVQPRSRTRCPAAMRRIAALTHASAEHRLEVRRTYDTRPTRLSRDEIGSSPLDQPGAPRVFQLISRRDERGSIVLTANQRCGPWGEVCGHPLIATALRDRRFPHRVVLTIQGAS
jgi:DNA replication protein DnaC